MKKFGVFILFLFFFTKSTAEHIIGGEMFYTYQGVGSIPNTHLYKVTLKLYRGNTGAALDPVVPITIFTNIIGRLQVKKYATLEGPFTTNYTTTDPCISPTQSINYEYGLYTAVFELQESLYGYSVMYQRCCRKASVTNLYDPSSQGSSYFAQIPGRLNTGISSVINSSPRFIANDSSAVCRLSKFSLDFSATDEDGDILTYSFATAYKGGGDVGDGIKCKNYRPDPACYSFDACDYAQGFSASSPMGPNVKIDPSTGIVSGVAPNVGQYVVTVLCTETRDGIIICSNYKEFLVTVFDCSIITAQLNLKPTTCNGFVVDFQNDAPNDGRTLDYEWDFGEPASGINNTSTLPTPSHRYLTAGDFTVKLKVSFGGNCADSTTTIVKVYPGFRPDFDILGQCKNTPIQFKDLTQADYGIVNKWDWVFGDPFADLVNKNTSPLQNPSHIYTVASNFPYTIGLKVYSSKGCEATITKTLKILDEPAFLVYPKDTLICTVDTLKIGAIGTGTVLWSPNYMIDDVNSQTPLVSPDVTTTYNVSITDNFGCKALQKVTVNVVNKVTQGNNYDTTICQTDAIQLRLFSDALKFVWTPNNGTLNYTTIKNPIAIPLNVTSYVVTGKISDKCFAQNTITVTPIPYPSAKADSVNVCIGNSTQLNASGGSIYNWSPRVYLSSTTVPNPQVINPTSSVLYTLTVRDILGCPKPVQKTVKLTVIKIKPNAGPRDTAVVINQPLQLNASGGTNYVWLPDNRWLSSTIIGNPIALPQNDIEYIVKVSDNNNCFAFDSIRVKLYTLKPGLYVPNAFTPNGDAKNDYFKPTALGIKALTLFQVYNRFGQLVYSNTDLARGWDGTFGGKPQDPATYIWIAEATDFTGKKITNKGSVILLR